MLQEEIFQLIQFILTQKEICLIHLTEKDLENGLIKFIGEPEVRIKEDYLRILRYLRFYLNYSNFKHDPKTIKAIKKNLGGISNLSKERLFDELKK